MVRLQSGKVWQAFVKFFREEKGYDTWTEDEIDLSMNDDDIEQFILWLVEQLERGNMECYNSGWQDGYREALDKVLDGINRNRQEADREGDITYLEDNSSGWSDVENLIEECRNE